MSDGGDDPGTEGSDGAESAERWGGLREDADGESGLPADDDADPSGVRGDAERERNAGSFGASDPNTPDSSPAFAGDGEDGEAHESPPGRDGSKSGPASDGQVLTTDEIEAYTTDRRSLAPRVQIQWGIRTAIGFVVLGSLVTAVLVNLNVNPLVAPLVIVALIGLGLVWVVLRYRVWVYQIRSDAIYLERGIVTHVRTLVPYVRIQHVDTSRGPLERALGLSTLVVYTAGSRGADVSIPGLRPDQASDLQQRVKELAIEAEGGDAL